MSATASSTLAAVHRDNSTQPSSALATVHRSMSTESSSTLATTVRVAGLMIAVITLYSAFANWGWNAGLVPAPPLVFMILVMACAGVSTLLGGVQNVGFALIGWCCGNAVLAMASFLWSSGSDVALQESQTRVLSSLLLVALSLIVCEPRIRRVARLSVIVATLVATAINVWEITHPMTFSAVLGRSAGFYVNPNIAGAAIVAGMLIGLPAVPARFRELFALVAGCGVLATLSRGALLCWILSVVLLIAFRSVRGSRFALVAGVSGAAGVSLVAALLASGQLGYLSVGAEEFVRRRLSIGNSEGFQADVSASSRSQLAVHALEMFGERPVTGHGAGSTVEWREPESTHNIYARQLAEYGVLGAWLAPMLLLIAWRAAGRRRASENAEATHGIEGRTAQVFVVFVAFWGLFSHNVLDDAFILVGIALVVADGARSSMQSRLALDGQSRFGFPEQSQIVFTAQSMTGSTAPMQTGSAS